MRIFRDLELVEQLGSGIPRILQYYPRSIFYFTDNFLRMVFPIDKEVLKDATAQAIDETADEYISRTVELLDGEMRANEILAKLNLTHYKHFRKTYLKPSIEEGYVEMTIPDKPSSPNQKYRLTLKGKLLKSNLKREG